MKFIPAKDRRPRNGYVVSFHVAFGKDAELSPSRNVIELRGALRDQPVFCPCSIFATRRGRFKRPDSSRIVMHTTTILGAYGRRPTMSPRRHDRKHVELARYQPEDTPCTQLSRLLEQSPGTRLAGQRVGNRRHSYRSLPLW